MRGHRTLLTAAHVQLPAPFGKYELLQRIATGGMAEVYLARSFGIAGFEKRLVIKRIRPELARDPRFVQLFIHEARISVQLNHPNVVQVYDLGRVGETWYMAMEHLHGRDLTRLVRTLRANSERLPIPVSVAITAELLRGLHYAHTRPDTDGNLLGLVHRDVSPHNVVITFDGTAKLVDFGVARLMNTVQSETEGERPGPGGGKYAYMSPEQASAEPFDHRTDVYSAAIVLWELITGHRLFQDPDPEIKLQRVRDAVIPDPRDEGIELDAGLWELLRRALARDPQDRFASAARFEEELRAWLFRNGEPAGPSDIARWMAHAFPGEAERPPALVDLRSLASDLQDMGHTDNSTAPPSSSLPGRLPAADAQRKPVTALVIDVDGLTDLSLRLEPEDLFRRQFRLLRQVQRTVDRHRGVLLRAVDDQIIALFGLPRTRSDDTARALDCATALLRDADKLGARGIPVRFAIGAHTGEVTGGTQGRRHRWLPRGDTTRLARRLSGRADHEQILCSDSVRNTARDAFDFGSSLPLANRGGRDASPAWPLVTRKRGLRVTASGAWLRRGTEVDRLSQALVDLNSGVGSALALTGPIGAGKSRFLREVRDLAHKRRVPFYVARCAPEGVDPPLEPYRDWLRQIVGDASTSRTAAEAVDALAHIGLSRDDGALLARFLEAGAASASAEELMPVLLRLTRLLAGASPTVLALEDVDRLGSEEIERFTTLVQRTADVPILWLITHKDPVEEPFRSLGPVIALGAFDDRAQRRMVTTALGAEDVSDELLDLVGRKCEGNALYLEEMLRFLVKTEQVHITAGRAEYAAKPGAPALPGSLNALVSSRLDALDPASKGVLQLAATIGREFPLELLAEAAGMDDVDAIVADLAAHHLVVPVGRGRYAFVSELVRDSVLHGILGVQRRDQHRLVASAMEDLYSDNLEPWHEALAQHCALGGRRVDAARYAHQAGQRLERGQFLDRALVAYQRGLAWLSEAPSDPATYEARTQGEAMLHFRIGRLQVLRGEAGSGERALQLSLDIAADAGLPWIEVRAHLELGKSYRQRGRASLASAHLRQAQAMLSFEDDEELELACLQARASLAFDMGREEEAWTLWRSALEAAGDDLTARCRCLIGLANHHLRRGEAEEATTLLREAQRNATEAGDRIEQGRALNNLGFAATLARRYDDALAHFRAALSIREGIGYSRGMVVNHHNIGAVHFERDDLPRAWVGFERSRQLATRMGWEGGEALNDVYLGYISALRGDATGEATLLGARKVAQRLGDVELELTAAWLLGRLLAATDREDNARGVLSEAQHRAGEAGFVHLQQLIEQASADISV